SELSHGMDDTQRRAFTQAAFNRVGENIGDRDITGRGGVVATMMDPVGRQFDGLTARNVSNPHAQLIADLPRIADTDTRLPGLYPNDTVDAVRGGINRIADAFATSGALSGSEYQTLRSNLRAASMGASDPQRAAGLSDIVEALDNTMERWIARNNPADAGAWS